MRRSIISSPHRGILLPALLLCGLLYPRCGLAVSVEISPHISAQFSGEGTHLEFGPDMRFNQFRFRLLGEVPMSETDAGEVVQFDRALPYWLLTATLDHETDLTGETGASQFLSLGLKWGWSRKRFSYVPDLRNLASKSEDQKDSYFITFRGSYTHGDGSPSGSGWQVSPQFRVKYEKAYAGAGQVGVVVPGDDGAPSIVTDVINGPPSFTTGLYLSWAVFLYPGTNFPAAYAPVVSFKTAGKRNQDDLSGGVTRVQFETWFFYFPVITGTPNVRIGISPYLNVRASGDDGRDKAEYGGLLQLRIGTVPFEY